MPQDERQRGVLMLHELFHRIQPQLGFSLPEPNNSHLETVDGRYWLQLEWRALAKALGSSGIDRTSALADALAFRAARRALFPTAADNERILEIQEGLAQYTGTVAVATTSAEAVTMVVEQLTRAATQETFIRTFAYPSGAAYGVLLDGSSPGWRQKLVPTDDFGDLVKAAAKVGDLASGEAAAARYGGVRAASSGTEARAGSRGAGQGVEETIRRRSSPHHSACAHRLLRHIGDGAYPRRRHDLPNLQGGNRLGHARRRTRSHVCRSINGCRAGPRKCHGRRARWRRLDAEARARMGRTARPAVWRFRGDP